MEAIMGYDYSAYCITCKEGYLNEVICPKCENILKLEPYIKFGGLDIRQTSGRFWCKNRFDNTFGSEIDMADQKDSIRFFEFNNRYNDFKSIMIDKILWVISEKYKIDRNDIVKTIKESLSFYSKYEDY